MCKTIDESKARPDVGCAELLDDILWRIKDIREDLMSTGIGGRCYNMDEWSTPVVNLDLVIKLITSNNAGSEGLT